MIVGLAAVAMVTAACSGTGNDDAADTTELVAASETTTTRAASPASTDVPTTTSTTTTSTTTTTTPAVAAPACPDLFRDDGDVAEVSDVVLAAWQPATGAMLWELPLGTRFPAWSVWSDEIVLGFRNGDLVGIDVRTCASWSTGAERPIADLAVLEGGIIVAAGEGIVQGFSGPGFGVWRHDGDDAMFGYVGDTGGVVVFVDQFGDLLGLDAFTGGTVFEWGGAAELAAVAIDQSRVYRSTGTEVTARPAGGGDVEWAAVLPSVAALYPAGGTLLALDGTTLHALDRDTGELRWSVPFAGDVAAPVVMEHGELHLATRDDALGFDTVWHLDPADGSTIYRGMAPANTEWSPEMDDGLVLQVGADGTISGVSMLERTLWTLPTGANRIDRFSTVELGPSGIVVTLTFSAERF